MLAKDLISHDIFPLKKTDTVDIAIMLMQDWQILDLPVVDTGKVLGYCDYKHLADENKQKKATDFISQDKAYIVQSSQHLFEVVKLFSENNLTVVAVVNEDNTFAGLIANRDLLVAYKQSALSQPGSIITLQMLSRNYSLAEISHLIESNDAKILHLFIRALNDENGHVEVSIKLNTVDLRNIISTLERYQYNITGIHQAAEISNDFQSRFDYLIKYMNT